jgi:hypothetical protein
MPRTRGIAEELRVADHYIEYWKERSHWLLPFRYLRQIFATLAVLWRR